MLALTADAIDAIEGILAAPGVPGGAGVRIMPAPPPESGVGVGLEIGLAETPDECDEVIQEAGARVFLETTVAEVLQDKLLDADRDGQQIRFSIGNAP